MKRVLLGICGTLIMVDCGGGGGTGGGTNPPAATTIYVAISPSAQINIDAGQTAQFSATVENDSNAKGVTWSCAATGSAGCGTFSNSTASATTYTAPPSVAANRSVTVTATSIADSTKSSSARVLVCPLPTITSTTLAAGIANTNYSVALQAAGGVAPLTWFVASGALPGGLSLASSGAITGIPTVPGVFNFTVQVTDSTTAIEGGPATAQAIISLTVETTEQISTHSLPAGAVGVAYSTQIEATGGVVPYVWGVAAGSLPAGLILHPASGTITGIPTTAGTFTFTVQATDSSPAPQCTTQSLTLVIAAPGRLVISTSTLTDATPNANYTASLQATGGLAPLTWNLVDGVLPTGLALAPSGVISGDPTVPGSFTFSVQVTDSSTALQGGPATATAELSINVVTPVEISTRLLPAGSQGVAYLAQVSAEGGTPPYRWRISAGALPLGLTLQSASGAISGIPAATANFGFALEATDSSPTSQTITQALTMAIGEAVPLAITTYALLDGTVNVQYNARLTATGGTPPYKWSIATGSLPPSMVLTSSTGGIAGTPISTGTANLTVEVTDSAAAPQTQTQTLSLAVNNPPEACTSSGNNGVLQGSYAFSLSGFNEVGFLAVVGAFTADGAGRISGGEADTNGVNGAQHGVIIAAASSYSMGPDNRGCATLATSFGTFTTHFVLGSISGNVASAGRVIEWDSPSFSAYIASGQMLRQDLGSVAGGLSGSYVFRTVGWDTSAQGGREACLGVLSAANNTLSGMEQDCNDAWTIISTTAASVAGTYTAFDASGRGTGIVTLGGNNSNIAFYAVSNSKLLVVNADSSPFASGEWDQQILPAGATGFTQASLKGNMVFYLSGLSMGGTASAVSLETANSDGIGALAINFYLDRAGAMQVSSPLNCAYAVEPSGRVILSSDTQGCGSNIPALYLTGVNTGFMIDAAPGVDTGTIEPQSAGPFSNASLAGNFFGGVDEVVVHGAQLEVDPIAVNGAGTMNGISDLSSMNAQDSDASFLASTCVVNADGTFSVNSSGGAVTGVIISSTKFVMFSPSTLTTQMPTVLVMQQ